MLLVLEAGGVEILQGSGTSQGQEGGAVRGSTRDPSWSLPRRHPTGLYRAHASQHVEPAAPLQVLQPTPHTWDTTCMCSWRRLGTEWRP